MSGCGRDPEKHCCWLAGTPCPFLQQASEEKQAEGFYWTCQLRTENGSWEKTHADPRYLETVKPVWDRCGIKNCGNWPQINGIQCSVCGDQ